jgi:hypothetical protein
MWAMVVSKLTLVLTFDKLCLPGMIVNALQPFVIISLV